MEANGVFHSVSGVTSPSNPLVTITSREPWETLDESSLVSVTKGYVNKTS